MPDITIGIGELHVSRNPADTLVTYALGSCIAVLAHDPKRGIGGLIHYMLPTSQSAPAKAAERPAMFADTGVPLLFTSLYALGTSKPELTVKIVGGAKLYEDHGAFEIGKRNHAILRKMFWKMGVLVAKEDVGGEKSRTVRMEVGSGRVLVSSMGSESIL
jgi:chemotaxis protein CheD